LLDVSQIEEVLTGLPPQRWPDFDLGGVIGGSLVVATPAVAEAAVEIVRAITEGASNPKDFLYNLDVVAIYAGGHGNAELAQLLLDICDAHRAWLNQEGAN
jgi:hypothetical protein